MSNELWRCAQVLYRLPNAQRTARRLLSAERSRINPTSCSLSVAALVRFLLLLGALGEVYAAERAEFLQRLAAQRAAGGGAAGGTKSHAAGSGSGGAGAQGSAVGARSAQVDGLCSSQCRVLWAGENISPGAMPHAEEVMALEFKAVLGD